MKRKRVTGWLRRTLGGMFARPSEKEKACDAQLTEQIEGLRAAQQQKHQTHDDLDALLERVHNGRKPKPA